MVCFVDFLYVRGIVVYVLLNNAGPVLMMDLQILMDEWVLDVIS